MPTLERLDRKRRPDLIGLADDNLTQIADLLRGEAEALRRPFTSDEKADRRRRIEIGTTLQRIAFEQRVRHLQLEHVTRIVRAGELRRLMVKKAEALAATSDPLAQAVGKISSLIITHLLTNASVLDQLDSPGLVDYTRKPRSPRLSVGENPEKVRFFLMEDGNMAIAHNPLTPEDRDAAKEVFDTLEVPDGHALNKHFVGFAVQDSAEQGMRLQPFVLIHDLGKPISSTGRYE